MNAVDTELEYVKSCTCSQGMVYQTLWDLLCNQLFTQVEPPWIATDSTFESVRIWYDGQIVMTKTTQPYTFTIETDAEEPPKANDVIYFGKDYYIIGAVSVAGNIYTCVGCILIDMSIIGVYASLLTLNTTASAAEADRVTAEEGRSDAEDGRVAAETARVGAEEQRDVDFAASQAARNLAYEQAESARDAAFRQAEAGREAYLAGLLAPWVVPGAVFVGTNLFVADDERQTPQDGYTKFHAGYRVHLRDRNNRVEEVIADDGDHLITLSGWKWKYTEEENNE